MVYPHFFQRLTENCSKDDLPERFKHITLIIFNYDRCIEYFIFHALKRSYNIPDEESVNLVKQIKIYHPYGQVGTLPNMGNNGLVDFGAMLQPEEILNLASKIKTFTEGIDSKSSKITQIKDNMNEADRLVFVGFALP